MVTLITGASSGIGLELARTFARNGHDLVLVARSASKLDTLAAELIAAHGIRASVITADLSERTAPEMIYNTLRQQGIAVDVLVNNAGFGDFGFFVESDWAKTAQMIDLNITALTHLTHLFLPDMVARKSGRVMNVASTASFQPGPLMAVYYATKSYVLFFSEAIGNELKGTGVTVTALCPGPTESGFQAAAALEDSKLVKGKKMPSSAEVAEYGYRETMRGTAVAVHGFMNNLFAFAPRLVPRNVTLNIVRNMSERAEH